MFRIIVLLLLTSVAICQGQEVVIPKKEGNIEVPAVLSAKVNRQASIEIKTTCKDLTWDIIASPPLEYDVFREFTDPSVYRLRITPYAPGTYYLIVAGASGDKVFEKKCVITVSGDPGTPTDNATVSTKDFNKVKTDLANLTKDVATLAGTVSQLVDAVNILTKGNPPPPVDAFTKSVQDAFSTETDSKKVTKAAALASVYRNAAVVINNQTLKTTADIESAMVAERKKVLGDSDILGIRKAIEAELNWTLGVDALPLTAKTRSLVTTQFARVQAALETLK